MIEVVIDTNVVVSAMLNGSGNEGTVMDLVGRGWLRACLSQPILAEYRGVLARPKFAGFAARGAAMLGLVERHGRFLDPGASRVQSPDPSDTMFIACAIQSGAAYLVTGNRRHFPDAFYGAARVVGAGELLLACAPGL